MRNNPYTMINEKLLNQVANQLLSDNRGILAADESLGTIGKRFDSISLENNHENRLTYRKLLFETPLLNKFISGVITFDETIRETLSDNSTLVSKLQEQDILIGIKIDQGLEPLTKDTDETVMKDIPELDANLKQYRALGASFSKFRAVCRIDASKNYPSVEALTKNAQMLAKFALLCQQNDIVPIVEPEVLMDGDHSIETSLNVTRQFLLHTFDALNEHGVYLPGIIIKTNMVRSGVQCETQAESGDIAKKTLALVYEIFPREIPGIAFLSGGMSESQATESLSLINALDSKKEFFFSFSYGRALQASCLKAWQGKPENTELAQKVLFLRAQLNSIACHGRYSPDMENAFEDLSSIDSDSDLFESNYSY